MTTVGRELEGKVALITGAGSGIGRAMAELFAEHGCAIVAVDVVAERVDQVVSAVTSHGGRAIGMVRNLSLQSEVERMVDDAVGSQGRIDILCNNAGGMANASPVPET
ncbi:MAG: SDR family NAD(P)-dependent oxidoreductase [Thaumarchaeota archaeon]|nr:SDR family NAD(P)-dependent oxidoreductase [Nitrososphaerota archaeon]